MLAILDGRTMAAEEARIPATDEGLLRGDGVFEVVRVYGGRPFALDEHLARMARSARNLRLPFDADAVRARRRGAARRGRGPGDARCCASSSPAAAAGWRSSRPSRSARDHRARDRGYAPTRILDGVKSLSYGANMLATRMAKEQGARRGAARDAPRARARGADVLVLLLLRRRDAVHAAAERAHPGLDHPPRDPGDRRGDRAAAHARRPGGARRRRSSPRRCARCTPSTRSTAPRCPPAPGPLTRGRRRARRARTSTAS